MEPISSAGGEILSSFSLQKIIDFLQEKIAENETASGIVKYIAEHNLLVMLITAILGVLCVFLGYKLFKFIIALGGFAVGLAGGYLLTSKLLTTLSADVSLIIMVVLGVIGMVVAFKIYKVGLFVACAWLAYKFIAPLCCDVIVTFIKDNTGTDVPVLAVCLAIAAVVGILALLLQKPVVIICTSIGGAGITLEYGKLFLISAAVVEEFTLTSMVKWIIIFALAAIGLFVQFKKHGSKSAD